VYKAVDELYTLAGENACEPKTPLSVADFSTPTGSEKAIITLLRGSCKQSRSGRVMLGAMITPLTMSKYNGRVLNNDNNQVVTVDSS
jgi:hypothetical protein